MKILITGSSGFLGSILYNSLIINNDVYTLNRKTGDYQINLANKIPSFKVKFDLIIHCAGIAHDMNTHCNNYFKTNVIGTQNLLSALTSYQIPQQIIYISSVSVYGLTKGEFINESFELLAEDAYGISKIISERILQEWCNNNDVCCTILRLPLIAGFNPPGNLNNMISFIKKGLYFNIDGGTARKSIVLGKDIATHIPFFINKNGIYNLTDGYHPTFFELSNYYKKIFNSNRIYNMPLFIAKILAKIGNHFNKNFPINDIKMLKITSNLTFSDLKAREILNWNPTKVLDDSFFD